MSAMALNRDFHLRRAGVPGSRSAPSNARQGILRRISAAIDRSLQRRVEREAGRFIAKRGGRLTDDIERQLSERFNSCGSLPYAPPRSFRPL